MFYFNLFYIFPTGWFCPLHLWLDFFSYIIMQYVSIFPYIDIDLLYVYIYVYIHMHMYSKFSWVLSYMRRLFCFNWSTSPLLFPWLSFILWPAIFEPWCGWHSDRKNGRISCASGWDGANRLSMRYLHMFSIKQKVHYFFTHVFAQKKNVCPNKRPSMWKGILGRLHPNWKICFPLWWN